MKLFAKLVNLEAVAAPAGAMPVVLGSGWPGVLLLIGHGLEGDFNRKRVFCLFWQDWRAGHFKPMYDC